MTICSFSVYRAKTGVWKKYQFGFNGGYIGWILDKARAQAKADKAKLVESPSGVIVETTEPLDSNAEWLGEI